MNKFINSISFENYRGFENECIIDFAEMKNITFLVGPNNSGKSLITRAFSILRYEIKGHASNTFILNHIQDSDFHNLNVGRPINFKFNINTEIFSGSQEPELVKLSKIPFVTLCIEIRKVDNNFVCCLKVGDEDQYSHYFDEGKKIFTYNPTSMANSLGMNKTEIELLCRVLYNEIRNRVMVFDAIRSFDREESDFYKNGSEILKWLHENKSQAEIVSCKKKVRNWLKNDFNLDDPNAVVANTEKKQLQFTFNDIEFSSEEIGTGYTMLYILLMEIVRNKKEIILIDEIESHLQPGLVRLLIQLIRDHGGSQYVLATHSSTVLESADKDDILYRFYKNEGNCFFENFFRNNEGLGKFREVCNELGVVPGDALLSNTVIWVEGPSEMFWLRAWLKIYFPIYKEQNRVENNLIEGLHFSILMTGGSTIEHYGFAEKEIPIDLLEEEEVLKVLKVNPNPFVVIDSDNANIGSAKHNRMIRIAEELNKINLLNPLFRQNCLEKVNNDTVKEVLNLWILEGRELENYVHPQLLKEFYTERSSKSASKITGVSSCNEWNVYSQNQGVGNILESRGVDGVSKSSGTIIHKNDLARYVFKNLSSLHFKEEPEGIEKPDNAMLTNLKENLDRLISYILTVNNIKTKSTVY
ncbi:AAA family ATPase [Lysinibacillus sp. fls2-241-R2A-57]|uniref:ATP-dependent nuclease n=1 Tax=Lysinibacillus sp. fls2-241-R2A-57 TaxID=3040292 RepID=UPI0025538C5E|nr:AAA family ATPase [Lysinibacillus sp. fls2-241-R2A-57]